MNLPHWVSSNICRVGILLAVMTALWSAPTIVRADAGLDKYNLAIGLYKQARWALATQRFELFLKDHPEHEKAGPAKFYLGLSYINQQDYKAAREVLRDFVKSHPTHMNIAQGRYRVAECSYLLDDVKAAQPELQEFLTNHRQDMLVERALPYLGDVQLRQGQLEAALATFEKSIQDHPQGLMLDDARFGRAKALEGLKRDAEAVQQYQELAARADSPRAAEAQFQIAARQFDGKHFVEAAAAYRDLVKRFPTNSLAAAARLNAGYALYQDGQFDEAAKQFVEAQTDPQNSATARYWRGLSLKSLGEYALAEKSFAEAAKEAGELPLSESIHFQRAICARQLRDFAAAQELFVKGVEQWPQGEFADDCLHAAAELAVEAGDLTIATKLLARFAKDYPGSGLRLHHDLLQGRVDLALASTAMKANKPAGEVAAIHSRAAAKFEGVLRESTLPRTQLLARYYLGLTQQLQNQHEQSLKTLAPVIDFVQTEGGKSEFGEALLVQSESLLFLKRFNQAFLAAESYLTLFPDGRQIPRGLYVVAIAGAQCKEESAWNASTAAWERLAKEFRAHPLTPAALLQLAELSDSQQEWKTSAQRYTALAAVADGTDNQAFALRGLAWAHFKQKEFGPAAENFGRVTKQFPHHKLASECWYYLAESYREDQQPQQALPVFAETFRRFGPEQAAAAGAEQEAPLLYAYRAGLQRARTLRMLQEPGRADEAYEVLVEKFPKPIHLDRLLDEWALLNYENENFARADEIFRRLLQETPDSDLADNARLSLTESDFLNDKRDEAKKSFEMLLDSAKSDPEVKERSLFQLIVLAVDEQRWPDVRQLSDRLSREFPNSRYLGYALYSEAESVLSSAKSTDSDFDAAKEKLQTVMKTAEKQNLAKDAFEGRAWVLAAEIAHREKNYPHVFELAAEFQQALPDSVFRYQMEEVVGRSYKQDAKFAEARTAFERVLNDPLAYRTPTAAKSQFLIAETYFLEKKWDEAFLGYQKVYSSYDHPDWQSAALLQSGKCDEMLQQWKEAAATYEQLLQEFPKSEHSAAAQQRLDAVKQRLSK